MNAGDCDVGPEPPADSVPSMTQCVCLSSMADKSGSWCSRLANRPRRLCDALRPTRFRRDAMSPCLRCRALIATSPQVST